jgi:rhamnosyltransferase
MEDRKDSHYEEQTSGVLRSLSVIIPTYNAARHWPDLVASIRMQGIDAQSVLVVDSSSSDGTRALAETSGFRVVQIAQSEFGHGRTRQFAASLVPDAEFLLYLTQDAILDQPDAVRRLSTAMNDARVGAAYGRQLARPAANAIERHARLFNYPEAAAVRTFASRQTAGIRAAFLSNSFALYRRAALEEVGGFPGDVIFGEDTYVAAKMLMANWKVAYQADATAIHSHPFTVLQEFKRYFDIGVHHRREAWMLESFGTANGEGLKFVRSELRYLRRDKRLIPKALLHTVAKLAGYRLGRAYQHLPATLVRSCSSNRAFWR